MRYVTWRDGLCAGVLLVLGVSTHWVTVNLSPSVPRGLYRYVRTEEPLQRGDMVRIPAVPFGRSWLASWLPLLKPVAGIAGDEVCVQPTGMWVTPTVEGNLGMRLRIPVSYGPVYQEHKGTALPVFWGCHVVGAGEVFVASHEPRSLDARYFGMTRVQDTLRAVPLWLWE